ncbi:MAG: response regulator, partial [Moraxellaceae bacterium]
TNYIILLACVMGACLGLALLIAIWLRGAVTKPIFAVTSVARHVMQTRDFSLRAEKFTEDEIGVLADAFNNMLSEMERRASALEKSNQSLEREMNERHIAEVALRLADQRKDEFLATLAHELRNPLAPISNGLHILRLAKDKPDIAENAQAVMERQLAQMVRLVDDLLDVSRINTGKLSINKTIVDVQSVMRDALESSGPFIESCGHTLSINMPIEPIYVDADPLRLAQVFSNILSNAAKYTNSGGLISIDAAIENSSDTSESKIIIDITDNGIGIAPDMLEDIFNIFTQINKSLERAHAGLGVGLALAKRLVELHGYELHASSKGLGFGSTFTISLKVVANRLVSENKIAESTDTYVKKRIMLIDDNVDFVTTMATLLETKGHDVRIAHDGFAALKIAQEFLPEIAFLDIGMPGMNGYDLARHLRELPETAEATLIAITGWGQEKDRQLSQDAGFDNHLVKPVDLAHVLRLIEATTLPS